MPEPVLLLLVLMGIPLVFMLWLLRRTYRNRLEALLAMTFVGLLVLFLFFWGQYPYVGSYYLRYAVPALMVGTTFAVFRMAQPLPWYTKPGLAGRLGWVLYGVGSLGLMVLVARALQAHTIHQPAVEMTFPLRGGTYYISTGGSNGVLNLHAKPQTPSQRFAVDIDKLDGWGRYAQGLLPERLQEHRIFGTAVYSPLEGQVIDVENGVADHPPFVYDAETGAGNYVIIEQNGLRVGLYHLLQGSVQVEPGDQVAEGAPLGRVGNSGFSLQPHLHIQASRSPAADSLVPRVGVPIRFNGRFLVRNHVFTN